MKTRLILSMESSPLPSPRLLSSSDVSPFLSPFHSPGTSPGNSPVIFRKVSPISQQSLATSPLASPKLTLRRAGSYRTKSKKVTTRMDDMIRKRKLFNRSRSNSTPDFNDNCTSDEDSSQIFSDHSADDEYSDFGEKKESEYHAIKKTTKKSSSRKGSFTDSKEEKTKSPTIRKKSLNALLDLKNMMVNHGPRLRRSQSQRFSLEKKKENAREKKSMSFTTDDETNQSEKGPLIKATTMWVPGYDFKTKQSTPLTPRRQSTPLFQRRGSREKIASTEITDLKQLSTPNLARRGSKDKLKLTDIKLEDNLLLKRSDSLPPSITLSVEDDKINYHGDDVSSSPPDRHTALDHKLKKFARKKKSTMLSIPQNGRVKQMSNGYEHGTVFWRRYKKKMNLAELERKHRSCEIVHDSIYRERAKSYETGSAYWRRIDDDNRNYLSSPGSESGYASPTDNTNVNQHTMEKPPVRPPTLLHTTDFDDGLSSSWSHSQWDNKKKQNRHNLTPDLIRVIATDLCVTEL